MSRASGIGWESDLERAKQQARDERRDIVLYFAKQP
jgi:hypothetical protein